MMLVTVVTLVTMGAAVVVVPNGSSLAVEWTGHHHTVASRANGRGT